MNIFVENRSILLEFLCIFAQSVKMAATRQKWSDWAEIFFGGYLGAYTALTKWAEF